MPLWDPGSVVSLSLSALGYALVIGPAQPSTFVFGAAGEGVGHETAAWNDQPYPHPQPHLSKFKRQEEGRNGRVVLLWLWSF